MSQAYVRIVEQAMTKADHRGLSQQAVVGQQPSPLCTQHHFAEDRYLCFIQSHQIPILQSGLFGFQSDK